MFSRLGNPYLSDAEIGCFTSHYLCLESNLHSSLHLHIIEDDAVFCEHTSNGIRSLISGTYIEQYDVVLTDMFIPPNPEYYRTYKSLYDKSIRKSDSGKIVHMDFTILDLQDRIFAGTASLLVNRRSIAKIHSLFGKEPTSRPRTNVDLFIRRLARDGTLRLGCLFPFVTSIRLEHVIGTTAVGRHDVTSELACNIGRQLFFIGCDLTKCSEYATQFLTIPEGDIRAQLLIAVLGFSVTEKYRPF
jgi:GR25 family glycosyltransferase involved in LPS biosynthesis